LKIKVSHNPYPHFVLDDAIDRTILNSLKKDIKEHEYLIGKEATENKDLSPVFRQDEVRGSLFGVGAGSDGSVNGLIFLQALRKHSSSWTLLEKYFTSDVFFRQIMEVFSKTEYLNKRIMKRLKFIKLKPRIKSRDYRRTIFDFLFRQDFHLAIRFSRYENNTGTTIHRDNHAKVMAFLLYLNTDGWDEKCKGGFSIFDNSNARNLCAPKYNRLSPDNEKKLKLHKYYEYKENRLLGFCNTPNSWHQAPPTRLNIDTNRDCFQVNLFLCTKKAKDLEILYKLAVHLRGILKKLVK
jgi:hypothetical protein